MSISKNFAIQIITAQFASDGADFIMLESKLLLYFDALMKETVK